MTDHAEQAAVELDAALRTQAYRDEMLALWARIFVERFQVRDIAMVHVACAAKVIEGSDGLDWLVQYLRTSADGIEEVLQQSRGRPN